MDLRPKATAILSDRKNYVDENGWVPKQIFNMLFLPLISSVDAARARENRVAQNGNSEDDDMNTKIFRGRKIICRRVEYRMRDEIEFSPDRTMIRLKKRPVSGAKQSTLIEYNGVVKTIAEWSKETAIPCNTIRFRLKMKWPVEKILSKSDTTRIEYNGVVKTIAQWGKETGINHTTIRSRLRNKWPMEKVFGTPKLSKDYRAVKIEYNGVVKTIAEWGKATGIHPATIRSRLRNKWPMEKVFGTAGIRPSLSQV